MLLLILHHPSIVTLTDKYLNLDDKVGKADYDDIHGADVIGDIITQNLSRFQVSACFVDFCLYLVDTCWCPFLS